MAKCTIELTNEEQLKIVFSYPNTSSNNETLAETIEHWIGQTLNRDGFGKTDFRITVIKTDRKYVLTLDGPSEAQCAMYAERIPALLNIGWKAWQDTVQKHLLRRKIWCTDGEVRNLWDPNETGQWRFFLTLGVGLVNHRTLQFFHYPPIRLLDPLRDSMQDPVTLRCKDLLIANGVSKDETSLYETRINSVPIAAPDDQGTNNSDAQDPTTGGLMPIKYFTKFQQDMTKALIKPHLTTEGFTIPLTAYGRGARDCMAGMTLGATDAAVIEILDDLKTPVLGSNHPFNFYYKAQAYNGQGQVGSGKMLPNQMDTCIKLQIEDLSVVRWQVEMAKDPSQNPWRVIKEAKEYWSSPDQEKMVNALTQRHGSLTYDTPAGLKFWFAMTLEEALKKA